jgi:hypothetical protein
VKTTLLLLSGVLAIVLGVTTAELPARPETQADVQVSRVPTKSEILANAQWGIENPEILDARLLFSEEATQAAGVGIVYDGEFYKPDDPVWVVAVKSRTASARLPDIGQGDTMYAGILWLLDATNGQAISVSSIQDTANDERLTRIKALPDRDGTIEIRPRPIPTIAPPAPTPTALPTVIRGEAAPAGE